MKKFAVGDNVLFKETMNPDHKMFIGKRTKIVEVMEFRGDTFYRLAFVLMINGVPNFMAVHGSCLAKIKDSSEPTTWEEIENKTGWKPDVR